MKPRQGRDLPEVRMDPRSLVPCFLPQPLFCDTVQSVCPVVDGVDRLTRIQVERKGKK